MSDETTDKKPDDTSADDGKKTDPAPKTGAKDTQPPKSEDKNADAKFTQEDVNKIVQKRLAEERDKLKNEHQKQQDEDERKRKEKELAEQGKLQELADTREKERDTAIGERNEAIRERDEAKARYDALASRVSTSVTAEIEALPEHLRDLAPAESDLDSRLEWLPKAKQAAGKEAEREAKPGNPRGPRVTNPPGTTDAEKTARQEQSVIYRDF